MSDEKSAMPTPDKPAEQAVAVAAPDHGQRTHHPYSISKLNHLADCSGFTSTDGTCEAAEEGERLHELMDKLVEKWLSLCQWGMDITPGQPVRKYLSSLPKESLVELLKTWLVAEENLDDDDFWLLHKCCKEADHYITRKPTDVRKEKRVTIFNPDESELTYGHYDLLLIFNDIAICFDWKFGWLPVPHAKRNKQGKGYGLGNFMDLPHVNRVAMIFVQPRLGSVTKHKYERAEAFGMWQDIDGIIFDAITTRAGLLDGAPLETKAEAVSMLKPGDYCRYCAFAGKCPKLVTYAAQYGAASMGLTLPKSFDPANITKPEDAALIRYLADVVEGAVEPIKKRACEIAKENGGEITATLPDGQKVTYVVVQKGLDRSLGTPIEVANVLAEWVRPEEVLGAATLQLGKLEDIVVNAMVANAVAEGGKLTKKKAKEILTSTLTAHGVLTRPDGFIEFLKVKKEKEDTKQLTDKQTSK